MSPYEAEFDLQNVQLSLLFQIHVTFRLKREKNFKSGFSHHFNHDFVFKLLKQQGHITCNKAMINITTEHL